MQKRRVHHRNPESSLPLTVNDISNREPQPRKVRSFRPRRKRGNRGSTTLLRSYSAFLCLVIIGILWWMRKELLGVSNEEQEQQDLRSELHPSNQLPLAQYPSLDYALQHSKLVGLYFAASWCPQSTAVSDQIETYLASSLLPSQSEGADPPATPASLSIVYVSSDANLADYQEYLQSYHNWQSVPFESEECTALKKHFSVCSKPEVDLLNMDRQFEIPTLLILDSQSHGVLTTTGAEDLETFGEKALDHWLDLESRIRQLEELYSQPIHKDATAEQAQRLPPHPSTKHQLQAHHDTWSSLFS
eukprot:Nitzschia sp. Nitz4//scaffold134_size62860//60626//61534//NITZ4_006340-RA/size62860-processed-gene-0.49-mRNA-1//-1//CDS//3329535532//3203//frame0